MYVFVFVRSRNVKNYFYLFMFFQLPLTVCYWCYCYNIICLEKIRDKIHFSTNYDIFLLFFSLEKRIFPLLCDKINQFPPKSHKLPSSIFLVHKLLFPWTFFFAFLLYFAIWMCVYMCMWILPLKKHQPWKPVVQVFHQF